MMQSVDNATESSSEPLPSVGTHDGGMRPTPPPANTSPRMSFFDEEYVEGRRVPSPTLPTPNALGDGSTVAPPKPHPMSDPGTASAQDCLDLQARINRLLTQEYVGSSKHN